MASQSQRRDGSRDGNQRGNHNIQAAAQLLPPARHYELSHHLRIWRYPAQAHQGGCRAPIPSCYGGVCGIRVFDVQVGCLEIRALSLQVDRNKYPRDLADGLVSRRRCFVGRWDRRKASWHAKNILEELF